ncbi:hypothetical protein RBB50_005253 [Rhinocladiella similis]
MSSLSNRARIPPEELVPLLSRRYIEGLTQGPFFTAKEFVPEHYMPSDWTLNDLEGRSDDWPFNILVQPKPDDLQQRRGYKNHVVVAVDGECTRNGEANASGGIGIFVREGSMHNVSQTLPGMVCGQQIKSQRAGLMASAVALLHLLDLKRIEPALRGVERVIIKSDSAYLVKGMTLWMNVWKMNGFKTMTGVGGRPVKNAELFKVVGRAVRLVQKRLDCEVFFWRVGRQWNPHANALATHWHRARQYQWGRQWHRGRQSDHLRR